jgi:hypothetical protein
VAVFQEPFLSLIFEGRKRVESRFSQNQVVPFGEVGINDIIALKTVGGPIVGVCLVDQTWCYRLTPRIWTQIRDQFASLICAEAEGFWLSRREARFATLMSIDQVQSIAPIEYPKSDRRGWVVERARFSQQGLDL